jgi:hypothetical protein
MHKIDEALGLALEGNHKKAWEICEQLERLGPNGIPDTKGNLGNGEMWMRHSFNRGWHLLQKGDFQGGMRILENGRYLNTYGSPPLRTNKQIWNFEKDDPVGKNLIIALEGGFGDEIIYARFVSEYKKLGFSKVYLAAAPELVTIFSRIEGCDGVILRNEAHTVEHDYWIPGFSSGWLVGTTYHTLSGKQYLTANKESVDIWKQFLKTDKKYKVGLRWAGNPKFEHQQFRTFPTEFLFQLEKAFPEIQFYSFQRDHNTEVVPNGIYDLQHLLLGWEDTAAAISEMDLMISSCTSIAHMSAALGKDTYALIPVLPYHVWAYGCGDEPGEKGSSTSPWYDSVTLFRQLYKNKWNEPFQDLYNALEIKFGLTRQTELKDCDEKIKRLNMGCGYLKLDGYINADISTRVKPDMIVDFSKSRWDQFEDNEFSHIVAKDILEHLPGDFCNVVKEMYRISKNGAIWELQFPHHRCDHAVNDPTHVRFLTQSTFQMFDRVVCQRLNSENRSESMLAFEHDVDIQVCEVNYDFVEYWLNKVHKKEMTMEDLYEALNFYNNVASSVKVLIQVHKPFRVNSLT